MEKNPFRRPVPWGARIPWRVRVGFLIGPACRGEGGRGAAAVLFLIALLVTSCATAPVGVDREDPRAVHRELTRSVLSDEALSAPTRNVLSEQGLGALYAAEPERAMARLHALISGGAARRNDLYAGAELAFLYAEQAKKQEYYLAAAVYAFAFLFPDDPAETPDPFDPRLRTAADLYNRGLTAGFKAPDGVHVEVRAGKFPLPFGALEVSFDPTRLRYSGRQLGDFVPVAELQIHGLQTRYRRPGIGAPLTGTPVPVPGQAAADDFLALDAKVSVTVLLRFQDLKNQLADGNLQATLESYVTTAASTQTVMLNGRPVPLEAEPTAALAYQLSESPMWERELANFFTNLGVRGPQSAQITAATPYQPGRIPVVFVHGTASSIGRWAEMYNRLVNDTRLRQRYQFWFFTYDTGSPIAYSAMLLRDALRDAVRRLDPDGQDPELRQMVLIGHSQGGLLVKMCVVSSGGGFYEIMFRKPLEELDVSANTRELIRKVSFVEPLPFVERVIFISTPHRGSYLTLNRIAQWITRFITLPFSVLTTMGELIRDKDALVRPDRVTMGTSIDNMNPNSPFLQTLAALPLAPGVAAHSIIAVSGTGSIEEGDDGVVQYQSAHLEGVKSELVVRSDHSAQWNAQAIEEVRRILLLHPEAD